MLVRCFFHPLSRRGATAIQAPLPKCGRELRRDEKIIKSLQSLLAEKGRISQVLINGLKDGPSADTVVNHFGSLTAAYRAVGYEPPARPPFGMNAKHWSVKDLLRELRKLYATHGDVSGRLIDSCSGLPSSWYIRRYFGSLPEAMRQAGFPASAHRDTTPPSGGRPQTTWRQC